MIPQLERELDRIGARKEVPWWNKTLVREPEFLELIITVLTARHAQGLRTNLADLFPIAEYMASCEGCAWGDVFASRAQWLTFMRAHQEALADLMIRHSMQASMPHHGAVLLEYMHRTNILSSFDTNVVVELGCSAGLLGAVFENYNSIFRKEAGELAKRQYFWLEQWPMLPPAATRFAYIGIDYAFPPIRLVPFFTDKPIPRQKLRAFSDDFRPAGLLCEQSAEVFLSAERFSAAGAVVLVTSFVLQRYEEPELMLEALLRKVSNTSKVHWLDLSTNMGLECLFGPSTTSRTLIPEHAYLSHNGVPVVHLQGELDDCTTWEYL